MSFLCNLDISCSFMKLLSYGLLKILTRGSNLKFRDFVKLLEAQQALGSFINPLRASQSPYRGFSALRKAPVLLRSLTMCKDYAKALGASEAPGHVTVYFWSLSELDVRPAVPRYTSDSN